MRDFLRGIVNIVKFIFGTIAIALLIGVVIGMLIGGMCAL